MTLVDSIILGIVEGLTEFLPISSTAHLVLASEFLGVPDSSFLSSFIIAIQLGAIGAVVLLYWRTLVFDLETMKRVAVAFIPTAVIGFALYKILKEYLMDNLWLIAGTLFLGGIVLIVFEKYYRREVEATHMSYTSAFLIGCAQSLAIVPGVSRAGATILGGLALGVSREKIVEFSFLLAIPTMLAATGYDLMKSASTFAGGEWELLFVGFVTSFLAAYAGVRWLIRYVQTHSFSIFGWYRIVLGVALFVWLIQ